MSTTALLILDGFGIGEKDPESNAIYAAGTPNIDALKKKYCHTAIGASGPLGTRDVFGRPLCFRDGRLRVEAHQAYLFPCRML